MQLWLKFSYFIFLDTRKTKPSNITMNVEKPSAAATSGAGKATAVPPVVPSLPARRPTISGPAPMAPPPVKKRPFQATQAVISSASTAGKQVLPAENRVANRTAGAGTGYRSGGNQAIKQTAPAEKPAPAAANPAPTAANQLQIQPWQVQIQPQQLQILPRQLQIQSQAPSAPNSGQSVENQAIQTTNLGVRRLAPRILNLCPQATPQRNIYPTSRGQLFPGYKYSNSDYYSFDKIGITFDGNSGTGPSANQNRPGAPRTYPGARNAQRALTNAAQAPSTGPGAIDRNAQRGAINVAVSSSTGPEVSGNIIQEVEPIEVNTNDSGTGGAESNEVLSAGHRAIMRNIPNAQTYYEEAPNTGLRALDENTPRAQTEAVGRNLSTVELADVGSDVSDTEIGRVEPNAEQFTELVPSGSSGQIRNTEGGPNFKRIRETNSTEQEASNAGARQPKRRQIGPIRIEPTGPTRIAPTGPTRIAPTGPRRIVPTLPHRIIRTPNLYDDLREVDACVNRLKKAIHRLRVHPFHCDYTAFAYDDEARNEFSSRVQRPHESIKDYLAVMRGLAALFNPSVVLFANRVLSGLTNTYLASILDGDDVITHNQLIELVIKFQKRLNGSPTGSLCANCWLDDHMTSYCPYPAGVFKKNYCNYCKSWGHNDLECRYLKN